MDVVSAVSGYISKMVSAGDAALGSSVSKMKILLLDSETVRVYNVGGLLQDSTNTALGCHCLDGHNPIRAA